MTVKKIKKRDLKVYSISQINKYLNCGRSYRYRYIDRIKSEPNENLILGNTHHKYFEIVLKSRMNKKDLSPKELNDVKESIKESMVNQMVNSKKSMDIVNAKKLFDILTEKWEKEILPGLDPVGVEEKCTYDIDGRTFLMYFDLINIYKNKKEIIDWKIENKTKNKQQVDELLQLNFYALASGIMNVGIGSIVKNLKNPKTLITRIKKSEADLKWCEDTLREIMYGIESSYFPRCSTENFLCSSKYCDYWDICRGKHIDKYEKKLKWKI